MSNRIDEIKENDQQNSNSIRTIASMKDPNDAAVLMKAGELLIQTRPSPSPSHIPPGYVLLAIKSVGICGSDVHYLTHGRIGNFIVTKPMIIGHETAAQVIGLGEGVGVGVGDQSKSVVRNCRVLEVGSRVAVEGGIFCAHCNFCTRGRYNLCPSMEFFATPPFDGSIVRYMIYPANLCFPLPNSLSYDEGAMCEPMSVAVMACNRGGIQVGDRVAVMGAGPIGLMAMLVARAYGAARVIITDISKERLATAKNLGADKIFLVKTDQSVQSTAEEILSTEEQVDITFDAVGASATMSTAIAVTRSGGTVVAIGLAESRQSIPMSEVTVREVNIVGMFRYAHTYPICIALLESKKIDVKPLITHPKELIGKDGRMQLDVLLDGFEIAKTGRDGAIKVMFHM